MCQDLGATMLPVLRSVVDLDGLDVVELGAGSGPITLALLPFVRHVWAYDGSPHMVATARENLMASGMRNWCVAVADHRKLPHPTASADLAVAGFTLGPMVTTERDGDWRAEVDAALSEVDRVLRPGSVVVILEGVWSWEEPADGRIAHPWFGALVGYLESEHGFTGIRYRNDKDFSSLSVEPDLMASVFGEEGVERLRESEWIMAECEGLWWRRR